MDEKMKVKKQNVRPLITGEPFHDLVVISLCEKDKDGKVCYLCKCKCGNYRKVRRSYLLSGRTKSCGCGKNVATAKTGKRTIQFAIAAKKQFVGDLSGALWNRIKYNALARKLEVKMTKEYAWELFLTQNKKCALTGLDLYLDPHNVNRNKVTASLDRIDSNRGYVEGNVQWVHKDVNLMKNGFPESYFKKICEMVTKYDLRTIK